MGISNGENERKKEGRKERKTSNCHKRRTHGHSNHLYIAHRHLFAERVVNKTNRVYAEEQTEKSGKKCRKPKKANVTNLNWPSTMNYYWNVKMRNGYIKLDSIVRVALYLDHLILDLFLCVCVCVDKRAFFALLMFLAFFLFFVCLSSSEKRRKQNRTEQNSVRVFVCIYSIEYASRNVYAHKGDRGNFFKPNGISYTI